LIGFGGQQMKKQGEGESKPTMLKAKLNAKKTINQINKYKYISQSLSNLMKILLKS